MDTVPLTRIFIRSIVPCEQRIKVDNSFGYCFYQCKFEISYMLDDNNSGEFKLEASNKKLKFAKVSNNIHGHLQYLELQFLI